ncbi:hypothetical protein P171DRAFT_436056 [Karstenula rhodostoma CBS 690.94]|uniref:Uncharacterized protein n=1 Tax=Karstenula rhodostoma CBS 690.94 TaxID=1392251 RepID=A0A9P4P9Z6_9PLEO|nr:hypothetical protein P171DRAFT_436056 [Karstenula rhodostoma CBS 690.94]
MTFPFVPLPPTPPDRAVHIASSASPFPSHPIPRGSTPRYLPLDLDSTPRHHISPITQQRSNFHGGREGEGEGGGCLALPVPRTPPPPPWGFVSRGTLAFFVFDMLRYAMLCYAMQ